MGSLLQNAKKIAKPLVPAGLRHGIKSLVSADYRMRQGWEKDRVIGKLVYDRTGGKIAGGPFAGLLYVNSAMGSTIGPKLLGTYEKELAGIVENIVERGYELVVNIGAGEGYYAAGLAKRMPAARVICFEAMEKNQQQLRKLAERNGVAERVEIRGFCTAESLADALAAAPAGEASRPLIVCDVEGEEYSILRLNLTPALRKADLLVEMHDKMRKGVSPEIRRRFQDSHEIQVVPTQCRTAADFPSGIDIPQRQWLDCLSEQRGRMTWFWMRAK